MKDHTPAADKSNDSLAERMAKDKTIRGFQTNAALPFHTDGCDMFALCCLSQGEVAARSTAAESLCVGKAGGATSIVSAVHVFNRILLERPDLAQVLQVVTPDLWLLMKRDAAVTQRNNGTLRR